MAGSNATGLGSRAHLLVCYLEILGVSLRTFGRGSSCGMLQESKEATNYYFCYRWLLILFKREFSTYEEVSPSPAFVSFYCFGKKLVSGSVIPQARGLNLPTWSVCDTDHFFHLAGGVSPFLGSSGKAVFFQRYLAARQDGSSLLELSTQGFLVTHQVRARGKVVFKPNTAK